MGALCVWIRNDSLYSQIQDINSGERGFTAVVSEKGELISSSNFTSAVSAYFDENSLSERLPDLADEQDISIGGENYQITTMVSPYTGWYFITANSQAEIIWQILSKLNVFAILLVLCVCFYHVQCALPADQKSKKSDAGSRRRQFGRGVDRTAKR